MHLLEANITYLLLCPSLCTSDAFEEELITNEMFDPFFLSSCSDKNLAFIIDEKVDEF